MEKSTKIAKENAIKKIFKIITLMPQIKDCKTIVYRKSEKPIRIFFFLDFGNRINFFFKKCGLKEKKKTFFKKNAY